MSVTADPQIEINEIEITNPALLKALEDRQDKKHDAAAARKLYKTADDRARALLGEHDLADNTVARIGQYKITKTAVPARAVAFETDPSSRITIALIPE